MRPLNISNRLHIYLLYTPFSQKFVTNHENTNNGFHTLLYFIKKTRYSEVVFFFNDYLIDIMYGVHVISYSRNIQTLGVLLLSKKNAF